MLVTLHRSTCIFEKCLFLPAATNRGSADKILLRSYTPSLRPHLCKCTARNAAVPSQGDTYIPAWRKALAVQEKNLFLLKSWTKDHFIQLQNVAFSEVERGRRGMAHSNSTLQFRP